MTEGKKQKKNRHTTKLGKSIASQCKSVMTWVEKIRENNQIRQVNSKSMEVSNNLKKKIRVDSQIKQVNSKSMQVSGDSEEKNQSG
jgi:hypothetical protein